MLLFPLASLLLSYAPPKAPAIELTGYFACRGRLLMPNENAAFTCYAPAQRTCQNGVVIMAYERRVNKPAEKTRFAIVDTLQVALHYPNNQLTIANCRDGKGQPKHYFVLCKQDALGQKYLRNVLRVWGVNAQGHLVEVPVKTLRCLNDDFGA